ncbi:hypothetical protein GCM10007391_01950 [Alteromonas halophila]|uniref:Uncharacterized protein n=1 Tax=Alteromonas halophila TaxID=516698 RepID=A0A918MVI1_9ALTE|nr:hypothetical protein GCM10007391_01950 [Alteromonas halophila]
MRWTTPYAANEKGPRFTVWMMQGRCDWLATERIVILAKARTSSCYSWGCNYWEAIIWYRE